MKSEKPPRRTAFLPPRAGRLRGVAFALLWLCVRSSARQQVKQNICHYSRQDSAEKVEKGAVHCFTSLCWEAHSKNSIAFLEVLCYTMYRVLYMCEWQLTRTNKEASHTGGFFICSCYAVMSNCGIKFLPLPRLAICCSKLFMIFSSPWWRALFLIMEVVVIQVLLKIYYVVFSPFEYRFQPAQVHAIPRQYL